jgi:hypothetical protein
VSEPRHRIDTDNGKYYQDPAGGPDLLSVTNVLNEWSKPALPPAAAKVTVEYLIDNLPRAVVAARRPDTREEFAKEAKAQYETVWEARRDLGVKVHHHAEAHILGQPIEPDPDVAPFLDQYVAWLASMGVDVEQDVEAAECTVLNREVGYGGTSDLWVHLRFDSDPTPQHPRWKGRKNPGPIPTPSGLWLIDIKTSLTKPASAVYRDHITQLAALRHATVALAPDDTEMPVPEFVGAAVLNLRTDSHALIPLPADAEAFAAFRGLLAAARYAHALDMTPYKPIAAPTRAATTRGAA